MNYLTGLLLILISGATFADQYLCKEEHAAGFRYEKSGWVATKFKADEKFIIKKPRPKGSDSKMAYVITILGREYPYGWCNTDFNERGVIGCQLIGGSFTFNKKSGRFLSTYLAGYVDGVDQNTNNPSMQIGTCSPL